MKFIAQGVRELMEWMRSHPITAVIFAWAFGSLGTAMAFLPDWTVGLIAIAAILFGLLVAISHLQTRKTLCVLMALSLSASQLPADPPKEDPQELGCAGVAAGAVVVVVGIVVVASLWAYCQKKFPRNKPAATNEPPAEFAFSGPSVDSAALEWNELGSCPCSAAVAGQPATAVTLTLRVDPGGELTRLGLVTSSTSEASQDWNGLRDEAHALGLILTGHAGNFSFARNGEAVAAWESPISWDANRRCVRVARGSEAYYTVVVERSTDLLEWTEVLRIEAEVGTVLKVNDASGDGAGFYRYVGFLSD